MRAHAKINVLLRVLAREASGYHSIETVFQRLALSDLVHVSARANERSLTCDGPAMPAGGLGAAEENLAWRAAALYMRTSRWDMGWDIAIEKHIPVGGGLGGGSANAAAVFLAMDAMNPEPLGHSALLELSGTLGSDIPFFVCGWSLALGWGRGDRLLPLRPLSRMAVTLVTFADGVNTGAAYAALAQTREARATLVTAMAFDATVFDGWRALADIARNDFEPVVSDMHPGVAATLPRVHDEAARLRATGVPAIGMLSGSGATCYLLHPPEAGVALALDIGTIVQTETA